MEILKTKYKYLNNFILGILAGAVIGLGGLLNLLMLSLNLKYLGGVLFSVGLFSVCFFSLHLYTGRIAYVIDNKKDYILSLLIMYLGNAIGAILFGYLMRLTTISTTGILSEIATKVGTNKIINFASNEVFYSGLKILIFSFFCGIMVFLAVDVFKKVDKWIIKIINLVVCVALFVICGMEHCIANMFYFAIGNIYGVDLFACIVAILIATLGNSLGAIASRTVVKNIS